MHDDLMILYQQPPEVRAGYFDNEQHVFHYTVHVSPDREQIIFLSDPEASAARFRFTYTQIGAHRLKLKFEIAPPGKLDQFVTYTDATARRERR